MNINKGDKFFSDTWGENMVVDKIIHQTEGYCCFTATSKRWGDLKFIVEPPWFVSVKLVTEKE